MSDRGVHPDLLEEVEATRAADGEVAAAPPEAASRGGRSRSRGRAAAPAASDSAQSSVAAPEAGGASPTSTPPADGTPPAWLAELDAAETPQAKFAILTKNLPKDELERDPTLQGWIGDVAQRRAKAIQDQEARDRTDAAKLDAARRGDLYQLGQLSVPEVQQQLQQIERNQQAAPLVSQVAEFQKTLPPEVQQEIQGKTYDSFQAYIQATVDAASRHGREDYFDQTLKEREPALRKAWLSEANGREQVPELEGGRAASVREITDEQLARMTLAETDTVLDEFGQPRPGIRLRLTRGIPLDRR